MLPKLKLMKKFLFTLVALTWIVSAKAQTNNSIKVSDTDTLVFTPPEFPGGQEGMYHYLGHTLRYPAKARENNEQGKVILQMIIENDGSISNLKIIKGVSESIDKETLRVVNLMPKWIPGNYSGKPVRTLWTFPVSFTLANN